MSMKAILSGRGKKSGKKVRVVDVGKKGPLPVAIPATGK